MTLPRNRADRVHARRVGAIKRFPDARTNLAAKFAKWSAARASHNAGKGI